MFTNCCQEPGVGERGAVVEGASEDVTAEGQA